MGARAESAEQRLRASGLTSKQPPRVRARLSRTVAAPRWREYRQLLEGARARGFEIVSLEEWVGQGQPQGRWLILRHDVDQHPRAALRMARIERRLGVRSTWYVRWRTADPAVISALHQLGSSVGLHYETLSRLALEGGVSEESAIAELLPRARELLRREITAFTRLHGPIASVCPHGDSRIPAARNARLLTHQDPRSYGVRFDGNEIMRGQPLAHWLTDRSRPEGGWNQGVDPHALFADGAGPILCLVHPNNWVSGASLWVDRALAWALPPRGADRRGRPLRTGRDRPPL